MFICIPCHDKGTCTDPHFFMSRGPCEICGKVGTCYDCHR